MFNNVIDFSMEMEDSLIEGDKWLRRVGFF